MAEQREGQGPVMAANGHSGRTLVIVSQPFFQWRGSPIRMGFNVQALSEMGWDVDFLTLPIGEDRVIPGVRILRVPNVLGVKNIPIGPSLPKAFFDVGLLCWALPLALRRRYHVVHGVEDTGWVAWIVARATGARMIFEKHSDPASHRDRPFKNLVLSMYRRIEAWTIRHADAVIGTGERLVAQAKAVAPRQTVHYIFDIPSSLAEASPGRRQAARAAMEQRAGEILALYVGSFAVYQGIDLMFASMPHAVARHPNLRFVIIGGTAQEIAARKTWLAAQGIEDRVLFVGKIPPDDLPNYLSAADILLSPRISGLNAPLKLLDYLKAGRAIVATDNEANRSIVDATCAVLAPAEPGAFAAAIAELAADLARRERLGQAGRKLVDTLYNFKEYKRRLKDCYDGVLNHPAGSPRGPAEP